MIWPFKRNDEPEWIEVIPGQGGKPLDEFLSFTYWEPSDSLVASFVEDARQAGKMAIPDITAPRPLDEPDGLTRLYGIVSNAIYGRTAAAIELFRETRDEIALVTTQILQGPDEAAGTSANEARNRAGYVALFQRLSVLESDMGRLERAVDARHGALMTHYDRISSEFAHELTRAHPFGDVLSSHWDPRRLTLTGEMQDFGQFHAADQIATARTLQKSSEGGTTS
ncbi:hypothetical protein [Aeromicrobium duanguangcaii]|uniref:hypothetical protein n=1 Tax=Aeromicrobium duanguangcaii TaxID=2968086 RepID=UPI002017AC7F|nr:hypothetical protein [Aeromicrobium duanguangcaii]MCL3836884.1 hypothetical protein [Aeromicrobium duanguangcaii]